MKVLSIKRQNKTVVEIKVRLKHVQLSKSKKRNINMEMDNELKEKI